MPCRLLIAGLAVLTALSGPMDLAANAAATDLSRFLGGTTAPVLKTDIHGRSLAERDLQDRLTVVSFVSADCSILCVTRTMDLDKLARTLPASLNDRVVFLAIDTDPGVDDALRLRAFANDLLGPGSPLRVLPSDAGAAKAILDSLHYPTASLPEPPPTILLFDRRGQVAMSYGGDPLDAPRLARDLAVLDTFTQGLGHPPAPVELTR